MLDIGPWNRDEAWWETGAARGQFQDLPRFVPEVWAAYENGYNGGKDAIGRYVTFPAMIDLTDGVYADLGMTRADWVDVTLTWVDAPSPPPLAPADRRLVKRADPNAPPTPTPAATPHPGHRHVHPMSPTTSATFTETGYRIDDDDIWCYFEARGRVPVFGFPVSRPFVLLGCRVQIFQRQVAQTLRRQARRAHEPARSRHLSVRHVNGSSLPAAGQRNESRHTVRRLAELRLADRRLRALECTRQLRWPWRSASARRSSA